MTSDTSVRTPYGTNLRRGTEGGVTKLLVSPGSPDTPSASWLTDCSQRTDLQARFRDVLLTPETNPILESGVPWFEVEDRQNIQAVPRLGPGEQISLAVLQAMQSLVSKLSEDKASLPAATLSLDSIYSFGSHDRTGVFLLQVGGGPFSESVFAKSVRDVCFRLIFNRDYAEALQDHWMGRPTWRDRLFGDRGNQVYPKTRLAFEKFRRNSESGLGAAQVFLDSLLQGEIA